MKIKFKRSDEIVKLITVNENQITAKRSILSPKSWDFRLFIVGVCKGHSHIDFGFR